MDKEAALIEWKRIDEEPLKNKKPALALHPFLEAVYRPGVEGHPIIDPSPSFQSLFNGLEYTDWLYIGAGTGFMAYTARNCSPRIMLLSSSVMLPALFGVSLLNSWARLVGIKAVDQV